MHPRHDPIPKVLAGRIPAGGSRQRATLERMIARMRRSRRGDDGEPGGEPCPVEPNRPLDLSGGAAASLTFGD